MITQLTNDYTQAYQLALDLAQKANAAYQYELGRLDTFIQTAYWNDQYKGLQAGESLLLDLRRMEASYLEGNVRELELTKQISLALTQPLSLVALRETGACPVNLNEELFDRDHPGHYFRRLRSVALTVPCLTGPYTGVNATLTLQASAYRTSDVSGTYSPLDLSTVGAAGAPASYTSIAGGTQIATSTGQNDAGLFDVNLRDERWLPFEGCGAISTWLLELDPRDNPFDFTTITDVIVTVRYTARAGNASVVRDALSKKAKSSPRAVLVSVRDTFEDAYYAFFNPAGASPTQQTLSVPLLPPLFPYSNLGSPKITNVALFIALTVAPGATAMQGTFGPQSGTAATIDFALDPAGASGPEPNTTLVANAPQSAASPELFTLTLPFANVPSTLAATSTTPAPIDPTKVRDILLVITYVLE
jgi:hypothetical protein